MSELGETLRQARIKQGISLDELEEKTKIRKRYLEAIEEQNFDILPGNFYVRAFIKNYAEAINLNPDDILELYKNVIPARTPETTIETISRRRPTRKQQNIERISKWAAGILMVSFLLLIVFLIYYYFYQTQDARDHTLDETPITERQEPLDSPDGGINDQAEPPSSSLPLPDETPETNQPEPPPEPEITFVNSDGQTDVYTIQHVEPVEYTIEITGSECWVRVRKDTNVGEELFQGMMYHGDSETWTGESLWIRLGRASDATVSVNGIQLDPFELATVKDLQFNFIHADDPSGTDMENESF